MSLSALLSGIGAILAAAGGIALVIHEFRRRDRKAFKEAIDELTEELIKLQHDYLELRKFMLQISQLLLENGIAAPDVPIPRHNL